MSLDPTIATEKNGGELFIAVDYFDDTRREEYYEHSNDMNNERFKKFQPGKLNVMQEKLSKMLKRRNKLSDEVKLTIEKEEKLEMTHAEIAHWIDTKARWMFPLFFIAFVIFYFTSIKYWLMDEMLRHV